MNRQDFEQLFRSADNRAYSFYQLCMYHMEEHPSIFWAMLGFSIYGAVRLVW